MASTISIYVGASLRLEYRDPAPPGEIGRLRTVAAMPLSGCVRAETRAEIHARIDAQLDAWEADARELEASEDVYQRFQRCGPGYAPLDPSVPILDPPKRPIKLGKPKPWPAYPPLIPFKSAPIKLRKP